LPVSEHAQTTGQMPPKRHRAIPPPSGAARARAHSCTHTESFSFLKSRR
jgi:hypothetical protein